VFFSVRQQQTGQIDNGSAVAGTKRWVKQVRYLHLRACGIVVVSPKSFLRTYACVRRQTVEDLCAQQQYITASERYLASRAAHVHLLALQSLLWRLLTPHYSVAGSLA
jgi:hypothetical protein